MRFVIVSLRFKVKVEKFLKLDAVQILLKYMWGMPELLLGS